MASENLMDVLGPTTSSVKTAFTLAVSLRDSEQTNAKLKQIAQSMTREFTIIGGMLDQLRNTAHRVDENAGKFLIDNTKVLQEMLVDAKKVLLEVTRNRTLFERLFSSQEHQRKQLKEIKHNLHQTCKLIQNAIPKLAKRPIPHKEFADFRKLFQQFPEKKLLPFDYSIICDTPNAISTVHTEDSEKISLCFMKLNGEHVIFSNLMHTWSSSVPKDIILEHRRSQYRLKYAPSNPTNPSPSTTSLPNEKLELTEVNISHDDVCGIALKNKVAYIATKHEITIASIERQLVIAQYGSEGQDDKTFKHISYLYIPSDNENNLYIVDSGQYAVHHYRINDQGTRFEFVRRYMVIADVQETANLVACVILNGKLFVSDDANNCLHIFDLNEQHQSLYLRDNSMTPFSPGSLCAFNKYLYVANCSAEYPSILVFNEDYQLVDCFRNKLFEQILAIDVCPNLNELFILTTTNSNLENKQRKRSLIVTTDLVVRSN